MSVIVPAFNPGPYLVEAVDSVLAQTVKHWELIVVDDGSTAPLPELTEDDRIRIARQPNGGPASARNLGLDLSTGEFVAFLDADDLWLPTKLTDQLEVMAQDPGLSLCATQFRHIDAIGTPGQLGYGRPMSQLDLLATGDGICTSSVMVRSSALTDQYFRAEFQPAEDFDMWIRLSGARPEGFVPTVEVLYRHHDSNLSSDYVATWRATRKVYEAHPDPAGRAGLAGYRSVYAHQAWDSARSADLRGAGRHLLAGVRISPRTTARLALTAIRTKLFG